MGYGMAGGIEPAAAAASMVPALEMPALGVLAHEQVVAPLRVGELVGLRRPRDMRLAAIGELALVPLAAIGAGDQQHRASPSISAPPRRRRARRSGSRGRSAPV